MDRPLVILDTETANLRGAPHLLEIGAVRVEAGEIQDSFQTLVRPRIPVELEATEIHGIRPEDLLDAPTPEDGLAAFLEWCGDAWMVAHSAHFDARVLGYELARAGRDAAETPLLDSLPLARRHLPEAPDHKLETLCDHLGFEEGDHHRALFDAVSCWKVIEECLLRSGGLEKASSARLLHEAGPPTSLAAGVPPPPRLPRRLRALVDAVRDGQTARILYGEGLHQPVQLSVLPRFLFQRRSKGYLEAECPRSAVLKTYRLDRIVRLLP
jgi:DNA polymerase III epsilon subunit family exonuclease